MPLLVTYELSVQQIKQVQARNTWDSQGYGLGSGFRVTVQSGSWIHNVDELDRSNSQCKHARFAVLSAFQTAKTQLELAARNLFRNSFTAPNVGRDRNSSGVNWQGQKLQWCKYCRIQHSSRKKLGLCWPGRVRRRSATPDFDDFLFVLPHQCHTNQKRLVPAWKRFGPIQPLHSVIHDK